jgi:AmmeMemoRadiSam system protein B
MSQRINIKGNRQSPRVREPAVAGLFYPAGRQGLDDSIETLMNSAPTRATPAPKALIVPHAGYVYSGPTAAAGYAALVPWRERYERVVLLGPCHRVPVQGIAASSAVAFRTPLGNVAVDSAAIEALGLPAADVAHRDEHSLEVHLPFLQKALGNFSLVPLVVGDASPDDVADLLDSLWDGDATLIVVSSDLSHYLDYESALRRDRKTCSAIEHLDPQAIGYEDACGAVPVAGLLLAAKRRGLRVETLDLRNSGDTAGDRNRVVGYGAWALS